jgi:GDPmannose 4,6-dehydratase
MQRSLVLGVNGQDGSYLAESLLRRGYHVTGIGRNPASRYISASTRFRYVSCDLVKLEDLARLINEIDFDFAFHFAAIHGADGFRYEAIWRDMMTVNVNSLHVLLEHARLRRPRMRVIYAGSCKVFPPPLAGTIDEMTPVRATCLYSIGKMAARDLIAYYRSRHRVIGTNLVLFNHESPRRPRQYLLPTLARAICDCQSNPRHQIKVRNLNFMIDWSDADELMDLAVDIAERSEVQELVMASGTTLYGRAAVKRVFARYGLDINQHIVETERSSDLQPQFQVSLTQLEREIGRRPVKTVDDIIDAMIATQPRRNLSDQR